MTQAATSVPVLDRILARMAGYGDRPALCWRETALTYRDLMTRIDECEERLADFGIAPGTVCALFGDYSPQSCATLFAMIRRGVIVVPLTAAMRPEAEELLAIAGADCRLDIDTAGRRSFLPVPAAAAGQSADPRNSRAWPGGSGRLHLGFERAPQGDTARLRARS